PFSWGARARQIFPPYGALPLAPRPHRLDRKEALIMKTVVVRNIHRTDAGVVKRLGALGVATVHEAYGRIGLMKPYLRPVWAGGEAAGTAVTVLAQPGDNWMIHVAVEQCQPGDILVVGCTADNSDGM